MGPWKYAIDEVNHKDLIGYYLIHMKIENWEMYRDRK